MVPFSRNSHCYFPEGLHCCHQRNSPGEHSRRDSRGGSSKPGQQLMIPECHLQLSTTCGRRWKTGLSLLCDLEKAIVCLWTWLREKQTQDNNFRHWLQSQGAQGRLKWGVVADPFVPSYQRKLGAYTSPTHAPHPSPHTQIHTCFLLVKTGTKQVMKADKKTHLTKQWR